MRKHCARSNCHHLYDKTKQPPASKVVVSPVTPSSRSMVNSFWQWAVTPFLLVQPPGPLSVPYQTTFRTPQITAKPAYLGVFDSSAGSPHLLPEAASENHDPRNDRPGTKVTVLQLAWIWSSQGRHLKSRSVLKVEPSRPWSGMGRSSSYEDTHRSQLSS